MKVKDTIKDVLLVMGLIAVIFGIVWIPAVLYLAFYFLLSPAGFWQTFVVLGLSIFLGFFGWIFMIAVVE